MAEGCGIRGSGSVANGGGSGGGNESGLSMASGGGGGGGDFYKVYGGGFLSTASDGSFDLSLAIRARGLGLMPNGRGGFVSSRRPFVPVVEVKKDDEEESSDLEPFFFDVAEALADNERTRLRKQEEARKKELRDLPMKTYLAVREGLRDFDPKQGGVYYNRCCAMDLSTIDLDEESPLGPMRYTDRVYKKGGPYCLVTAVDFISVKIASLDVDFPVLVYGTVIARDSIDRKCVYLFQRSKDHCQLINSKDESLILTGPKRGLLLLDDAYVEVDLKIRDHERQRQKELSKGVLVVTGISGRTLNKCKIESVSLATRLSTVEVVYAVVKDAVEATFEIKALHGEFYGKITACTSSISNAIVLHDSKVAGVMTCDDKRIIQLLRRVVAVCLDEKLEVTAVALTGDGECKDTIDFTPDVCSASEGKITVGATEMLVNVTWSVIDGRY